MADEAKPDESRICPHCGGTGLAPETTVEDLVAKGKDSSIGRKPRYGSYPAVMIGIRGHTAD